jgi:hypothetical protein
MLSCVSLVSSRPGTAPPDHHRARDRGAPGVTRRPFHHRLHLAPLRIIQRPTMWGWLNDNAAAVQAVGSVGAILVAIAVAGYQTWVARRDREATRRRAAEVLAMELEPIVEAIRKELARALRMEWDNPHHTIIPGIQGRRLVAPEALERALDRLAVLDEETIRPIQSMLSMIRDYHRMQSQTDLRGLPNAALAGEIIAATKLVGCCLPPRR